MLNTLQEALQEQIRDLYSAEMQLVKVLPRIAKAVSSDSLRDALNTHSEETREHVLRLEKAADLLDVALGGKRCKAMEGLIAEGSEMLKEDGEGAVIDMAIIAAAQRVEHYEIAAYGTARAIAETLGNDEVARLLQETLDEEGAADRRLTEISQDEILFAAAIAGEGE